MNTEIEELLRGAATLPVFWQFVGLGDQNYGVLQRLDTLTDRIVDNTGFFSVDDLDQVSDADLYDRLLDQFPQWVTDATRLGIIGPPSPDESSREPRRRPRFSWPGRR